MKNPFYLPLLFICAALLLACEDKKELSRSKAKRLITEKFGFPVSDTIVMDMQGIRSYNVEAYRYLEKKGLVKLTSKMERVDQYSEPEKVYAATLTEDGKEYLLGERTAKFTRSSGEFIPGTQLLMRGHVKELGEITGIQFMEFVARGARVDFEVVEKEFTPFDILQDRYLEDDIESGKERVLKREIKLQLYDDGWRITDTNW